MGMTISIILQSIDFWVLSWPFLRALFSSNNPPTDRFQELNMSELIQPPPKNPEDSKQTAINQVQFKEVITNSTTTLNQVPQQRLQKDQAPEEERKVQLSCNHAPQDVIVIPASVQTVNALISEAGEFQNKGELQKAERRYKACITWLDNHTNVENRDHVLYALNSSMALISFQLNKNQVQSYLSAAQEIYQLYPWIYAEEYITLLCSIGINYYEADLLLQAKKYTEQAHQLALKYFSFADERLYSIINNLISLYLKTGDKKTAKRLYEEACSRLEGQQSKALKEMLELINSNYRQGSKVTAVVGPFRCSVQSNEKKGNSSSQQLVAQ